MPDWTQTGSNFYDSNCFDLVLKSQIERIGKGRRVLTPLANAIIYLWRHSIRVVSLKTTINLWKLNALCTLNERIVEAANPRRFYFVIRLTNRLTLDGIRVTGRLFFFRKKAEIDKNLTGTEVMKTKNLGTWLDCLANFFLPELAHNQVSFVVIFLHISHPRSSRSKDGGIKLN